MNLKNIKERQPELQQNSDSAADNSQVSPTCPKPNVSGSSCVCKECKKEFEPYNWFIECESCDEGIYETLMFDYGQGSSFIRCPYCKGKGGWDTVEKETCRSCKEYKEYENSDDFEDDNYCPACGRSDDR